MATDTGNSKRACASIYFRFSSLLGLHPMQKKQMSRKQWQIPRRGQWKPNVKPTLGYQLAPWPLTLD